MKTKELFELFATKENKEDRGVMKITITKDGKARCRSRIYSMTESDWSTLLASLEAQGIEYDYVTHSVIIIVKYETKD